QQGHFRRFDREITPVSGALVLAGRAYERPRDDARGVVGRHQDVTRDFAGAVQLLKAHGLLVSRYLENRIRRRVHDPRAGALVLLAELRDHRGATRGHVADDATTGT